MRRGTFDFRSIFVSLVFASLTLSVSSVVFAEDAASPLSADTSGSSTAAAGSAGDGSSTSTAAVGVESNAENDDTNSSAGTETGGAAASTQTSDDGTTAAAAATGATASAENNGTELIASAEADAGAGSIATSDTGLATTGSDSNAFAIAKSGENPSAYTTAGNDVFALAIGGERAARVAEASAGEDSLYDKSEDEEHTITIAYTASGRYSVAIAEMMRATAFSYTFGDGAAFTVGDVFAAAKTAAFAWASAGRTDASALAASRASSLAGNWSGISAAASASRASANVRINISSNSNGSSASGGGGPKTIVQCVVRVKDWGKWKKLSAAVRQQASICGCPTPGMTAGLPVETSRLCPKNARSIFTAGLSVRYLND